jgi:hypothetical protein
MPRASQNTLYGVLKRSSVRFDPEEVIHLFSQADRARVEALAQSLATYISTNVPGTINRRRTLADYRINPYVVLTTARAMGLDEPADFAQFLVNSKLYAGLETSFGKSLESAVMHHYPVDPALPRWSDPPGKLAEFAALQGMSNEEKARARTAAVWREIDKACTANGRAYLLSIKSGPSTINDTQVEAMKSAIVQNHGAWLSQVQQSEARVTGIDVVIGLTYGTEKTTNNKENQILAKLLEHGFVEEDREASPGVLTDAATRTVRVYRHVGRGYWSFIGNPTAPEAAQQVFLEVLLALSKALSDKEGGTRVADSLQAKILELSAAIATMAVPRQSLPQWIRADFSDPELVSLAAAMSAFYDEGI